MKRWLFSTQEVIVQQRKLDIESKLKSYCNIAEYM